MSAFWAEFIGTAVMILLGNGAIANSLLHKTKAHGTFSWLLISTGWAFAVFVGVEIAGPYSGAQLNPAVSISLAVAGKFPWHLVPEYIAAQMLGAMSGALLVWILYRPHFKFTDDETEKLMCFCTSPSHRDYVQNFISEVIGTYILLLAVLYVKDPTFSLGSKHLLVGFGSLGALPVAIIVWGIVISLGANTGCALNPARDLGPRIIHAILPIKGSSDWQYALIPIIAPICGGILATLTYLVLGHS